jgi:hypothetical protein
VKHTRASALLLALLLVITAACARDDDGTANEDDGGETPAGDDGGTDEGDGDTALEEGGFGDLEAVCQDGDASGATEQGVTDTEILISTVTDKGFEGLNKEMFDTASAFVDWCNEHGGILGRELELTDADAALTSYEPVVQDACDRDFAMVGGGAVLDDDPNDVRVGCGLANIAGYVVSENARVADLQVQPVPNGLDAIGAGRYNAVVESHPDAMAHYGIMTSSFPSVILVRDQLQNTAEDLGFTVDYSLEYAPAGETGWDNFARDIKDKGIKILEFIGRPENLAALDQSFETAGYRPDVILLSTNFYDSAYKEASAGVAGTIYIQSAYHPLELASDNKGTQDYLDLMEQYNPDGKIAQLGQQTLSAFLLFARAATECGSELTRACLLEEAEAQKGWTGGGMHAPMTPGNADPTPCFLIMGLDADGFFYDEDATRPTDGDGLYNCDPENISDVSD